MVLISTFFFFFNREGKGDSVTHPQSQNYKVAELGHDFILLESRTYCIHFNSILLLKCENLVEGTDMEVWGKGKGEEKGG